MYYANKRSKSQHSSQLSQKPLPNNAKTVCTSTVSRISALPAAVRAHGRWPMACTQGPGSCVSQVPSGLLHSVACCRIVRLRLAGTGGACLSRRSLNRRDFTRGAVVGVTEGTCCAVTDASAVPVVAGSAAPTRRVSASAVADAVTAPCQRHTSAGKRRVGLGRLRLNPPPGRRYHGRV